MTKASTTILKNHSITIYSIHNIMLTLLSTIVITKHKNKNKNKKITINKLSNQITTQYTKINPNKKTYYSKSTSNKIITITITQEIIMIKKVLKVNSPLKINKNIKIKTLQNNRIIKHPKP